MGAGIILTWCLSVSYVLTHLEIHSALDFIKNLGWLAWIQFLCVGLFVTSHDACHGSVAPNHPRINRWIGRIAAFLYAGFFFDAMITKHSDHHAFAGSEKDPDFHSNEQNPPRFFSWMLRFFSHYLSIPQLLWMTTVSQILMHGFQFREPNVLLFWALPSTLSAIQLFYFGTYRPHCGGKNPFQDRHHARNSIQPYLSSLVSCFHFGAYHHFHHLKPSLPWFRLPQEYRKSQLKQH